MHTFRAALAPAGRRAFDRPRQRTPERQRIRFGRALDDPRRVGIDTERSVEGWDDPGLRRNDAAYNLATPLAAEMLTRGPPVV
jgi:hypothetical protein